MPKPYLFLGQTLYPEMSRTLVLAQSDLYPVLSRREQALMWQPLPPLEEESVSDSFGGIAISGLNTTIAHLML